jgi:hypothetical protein
MYLGAARVTGVPGNSTSPRYCNIRRICDIIRLEGPFSTVLTIPFLLSQR